MQAVVRELLLVLNKVLVKILAFEKRNLGINSCSFGKEKSCLGWCLIF